MSRPVRESESANRSGVGSMSGMAVKVEVEADVVVEAGVGVVEDVGHIWLEFPSTNLGRRLAWFEHNSQTPLLQHLGRAGAHRRASKFRLTRLLPPLQKHRRRLARCTGWMRQRREGGGRAVVAAIALPWVMRGREREEEVVQLVASDPPRAK